MKTGSKRKVSYQPSNPTIQSLYENYKEGDLVLAPDFQRNFVWNKQKTSVMLHK